MKTNKEFIDGIYNKADEILNEQKTHKTNNISKISSMAAIFVMIISIGMLMVNHTRENNIIKDESDLAKISERKISLSTVGNFENLCNIIKTNSALNDTILYNYENFDTAQKEDLQEAEVTNSSSKTNNQVENVDEADKVKVSNNYIYYITDSKIVIIDARDAKESKKVAEINCSEEEIYPEEIFVNNNKLIVIAKEYTSSGIYNAVLYDSLMLSTSKTLIIIYDISNKNEPKEIRQVEIEGSYISSRMIKNNIYFATSKYIYAQDLIKDDIENLDETNYEPHFKDTAISEDEICIPYDAIYCFNEIQTTSYLMVAGLNLDESEEVDIQTFLGAGNNIYASENYMYIVKENSKFDEKHNYLGSNTHILKFALDNGKIEFEAETEIEGSINNQFSMDEKGEYFRIATTIGDSLEESENMSNSLYILNNRLETVGKISEIAKGERIYSVRYVGDKAYVVTFKQTDPLFVIDLSNPTNPQILGELKIPGYSTYLHPYDETHLIGFGYDTKEDGIRTTTTGLKMVMFDVSDLNSPKQLFKVAVADRNTTSELTYNHKALLYSKEKNIIAFPLTTYNKNKTYTRAVIYEINLEQGFILKGEIANENYNSDKRVERIIYVNDVYYTLSRTLIKVADMETLQVIKEIDI